MSKEAEAQHFEEKSNSIEEVELRNAQNLNARLAVSISHTALITLLTGCEKESSFR